MWRFVQWQRMWQWQCVRGWWPVGPCEQDNLRTMPWRQAGTNQKISNFTMQSFDVHIDFMWFSGIECDPEISDCGRLNLYCNIREKCPVPPVLTSKEPWLWLKGGKGSMLSQLRQCHHWRCQVHGFSILLWGFRKFFHWALRVSVLGPAGPRTGICKKSWTTSDCPLCFARRDFLAIVGSTLADTPTKLVNKAADSPNYCACTGTMIAYSSLHWHLILVDFAWNTWRNLTCWGLFVEVIAVQR